MCLTSVDFKIYSKIVAVRQYVSQMYICNIKHDAAPSTHKSTEPFRRLRGILSSDKPYKEMLEDALREKYSI